MQYSIVIIECMIQYMTNVEKSGFKEHLHKNTHFLQTP